MSKLADMAMAIQELHDAAAAIDDVANWLTRQFSSPDPKEPEPKPAPTLEQVRAVLAEKSRAGHTAAIRELLRKYGAEKLSLHIINYPLLETLPTRQAYACQWFSGHSYLPHR